MKQPHPIHCNHECVCMGMPNFYEEDEPCTKDKCKHDTRTHTHAAPATFPNSTELIQMAETEWHNREERFGLHDKIPWTTGWMGGFLTPNKPGLCDKCDILEVEELVMELEQELKDARKAEREQYAEQIRTKVKEINDSGTCPYGWKPLGRECNDDCTRCIVEAAIESLRGGAA